jgi:hypothetical protein
MEHVITKHILNHLENNSLLYDLQHGFRHSRSCETQLLSFVQELAANSDKNIQTDLTSQMVCSQSEVIFEKYWLRLELLNFEDFLVFCC